MTEVRLLSSLHDVNDAKSTTTAAAGGIIHRHSGLFATRDYQVGEVIVLEDSPLVHLAAPCWRGSKEGFAAASTDEAPAASVTTKTTTTATWSPPMTTSTSSSSWWWTDYVISKSSSGQGSNVFNMAVPASLVKDQNSDNQRHREVLFREMVQASISFVHYYVDMQSSGNIDKNQSSNGRFNNNIQLDPNVQDSLFALYFPSFLNTDDEEETPEGTAIRTAQAALQWLQQNAKDSSKVKLFLQSPENHEILLKIMLIWTCNSFEDGRIYQHHSRINHACRPNAVVTVLDDEDEPAIFKHMADWTKSIGVFKQNRQAVKAATPIVSGQEITISYLGSFMYAERATRQTILRQEKHFDCRCWLCLGVVRDTQCHDEDNRLLPLVNPDPAFAIPCLVCHPRISKSTYGASCRAYVLDEDVQYDDDQFVHYMSYKSSTSSSPTSWILHCDHCQQMIDPQTPQPEYKNILHTTQVVSDKVISYLRNQYPSYNNNNNNSHHNSSNRYVVDVRNSNMGGSERVKNDDDGGGDNNDDDDDNCDNDNVHEELIQHHVRLASSVLGAKHWATNLVLLRYMERSLQRWHARWMLKFTRYATLNIENNSSSSKDQRSRKRPNAGRDRADSYNDDDDEEDDELILAEQIDSLQLVWSFVERFELSLSSSLSSSSVLFKAEHHSTTTAAVAVAIAIAGTTASTAVVVAWHPGHLLCHAVVAVARALVNLGDQKSQSYAAEWIGKITNYVDHFESISIQKVTRGLLVADTKTKK